MAERDNDFLRLLDLGLPDELPEEDLRKLGFRDPTRVKEGLGRLRTRVDVARAIELHLADLLRALARCSDPDEAFTGLERWLEAGGAALTPGKMEWCDEACLRVLCALFANTPALAEYLIHFPARTAAVVRPVVERSVAGGRAWGEQVRAALAAAGTYAEQLAALRRARTEASLQIAALDLCALSPLEDTLRALSGLADACLDGALLIAEARLRPQLGAARPLSAPRDPGGAAAPPFVVLAMGKLGGRELNYSSDMDLVFAYTGEGLTEGGPRPVEHREYFRRLAEELLAALGSITEDGRLYRVDMRLRPYGSAGPLVLSLAETLSYLQAEGRTWERQAWLKCRPVAGDLSLGDALLLEAAPFIYPRFLSLEAIGDLQALKRQMELEVARRGEADDEVKLGRGGIRDIEFTVQFLQLLHGGQQPAVRSGNTLRALGLLRQHGLLTQREAAALEEAYVFWRNVEHRLQLHRDLQTHKLPADPAVRRRIARSLGFADAGGPPPARAEELFERERARHVARVREVFESLFAKLFQERSGTEGQLSERLLVPEPDLDALAGLLPPCGFAGTRENARELLELARDRALMTNPARTRRFFASLAPLLLKALAATGDPEGALRRFSRVAGSLGGKAVFYQSLHENPWLLKMTAELAAWSEYLTDILVANPGLFDELVDALRTGQSKPLKQMSEEVRRLTSGGDVGDTLRAYRAGEVLRIGVRDLFHQVPLEQTQSELTDLATVLLRAQLEHTRKALAASRGVPKTEDGREIGFAVLAVGKFGGHELNYGSDLDVLFFYDAEGATPDGLPAGPYFTELGQDLSRTMGTATALGPLYALDARLRPNGNKGPLASSLAAFERYWKDGDLADWERLALTRAEYVAGDANAGERAEHLVRSAVYSPLRTRTLAQEVRAMRKRLEETAEEGNLKRGRGGIVDIEFLVQHLQLLHGSAYPPVRQTNTVAALKALLRFKKVGAEDGQALLEAHEFLTRMSQRVRIVHGLSANRLPSKPDELQKLALRAGYADAPGLSAGEALMKEYRRYTETVRKLFEKLVV